MDTAFSLREMQRRVTNKLRLPRPDHGFTSPERERDGCHDEDERVHTEGQVVARDVDDGAEKDGPDDEAEVGYRAIETHGGAHARPRHDMRCVGGRGPAAEVGRGRPAGTR